MKHKQVTEFHELSIGDRFYLLKDKAKVAYEITKYMDGKLWYNQVIDGRKTNIYDKSPKPETQVVFLRHKNDPE